MKMFTIFRKAVVACLFIAVCLTVNAKEKLSWNFKALSAGKADVSTGGYLLIRHLGAPGFSPEFTMPIQLVYNSLNEKRGLFGRNWKSPQLESRIFPRENGAEWTAPWGETLRLARVG